MVDLDRIEEEQMTEGEVLDRYTEQPMDCVEWLPEWDEYPEEQPGENACIQDDTLLWENGEFVVRLKSHETTHWKAEIDIPEPIGEHYVRPIDIKCRRLPEYGFVSDVRTEDYVTAGVTLVISENFMPIHELNKYIDDLRDSAKESQRFMDDLEAGLEAAKDSEE